MTTEGVRPRRPWVAFLLSLLQPGLGQLYCGRLRSAGCFYALHVLCVVAVWATLPNPSLAWFLVGCSLATLGLILVWTAAVEAAIGAKRLRDFRSVWYTRWYGCLVVCLVVAAAIEFPASSQIRRDLRTFHMPSASMIPTLQIGDYFVAQTESDLGAAIKPCEVVLFRKPPFSGNQKEVVFVKRVVALSGDTVGYSQGHLILNGFAVPREQMARDANGLATYRETLPSGCSYLIQQGTDDNGPLDNVAEITVPAGAFYVLGDNRDNSVDSRLADIGPIPFAAYRGRAAITYWAKNVRRIGTLLN